MINRLELLEQQADRQNALRIVDLARDPANSLRGVGGRTDSYPVIEQTTRYDAETGVGIDEFCLGLDELGGSTAELVVRGEKPNYAKP